MTNVRKIFLRFLFFSALLPALVACSGDSSTESVEGSNAAPSPSTSALKPTGKYTINPQFQQALSKNQ